MKFWTNIFTAFTLSAISISSAIADSSIWDFKSFNTKGEVVISGTFITSSTVNGSAPVTAFDVVSGGFEFSEDLGQVEGYLFFNTVGEVTSVNLSDFTAPSVSSPLEQFGLYQSGSYYIHQYLDGTVYKVEGSAPIITSHATVSAVPEPETYAMILAGMSIIGLASRRQLNKST